MFDTAGIRVERVYMTGALRNLICSRRAAEIILVLETRIFGYLRAQLIETSYDRFR